jgi:acetyltransferase-like isoleucine patch superfamily enzyme
VHENSIIAAGSVVTKDVPPETAVKGIPAKPMMTRQEYENKRKAFIDARKKTIFNPLHFALIFLQY